MNACQVCGVNLGIGGQSTQCACHRGRPREKGSGGEGLIIGNEDVICILQDSLAAQMKGSKVSVHMASPGVALPSQFVSKHLDKLLPTSRDTHAGTSKGSNGLPYKCLPSAGMVATDLLLGSVTTRRSAQFINVLAEDAAVVARWLAPRMRGVKGNGSYFK